MQPLSRNPFPPRTRLGGAPTVFREAAADSYWRGRGFPLPDCAQPGKHGPAAALPRPAVLICPFQEWYDTGMTRSKIAISLPRDQLVRVHREVRAGRADSVSGYIARVLAEHERRESLRRLLRDLIEQYGEPAAEDVKWAERALASRRG